MPARPPHPAMNFERIERLGDLGRHRHGLTGHCLDCAALYRMDRRQNPPSSWTVDLAALIAERGADLLIRELDGLVCPYCGSTNTEFRLTAPSLGDG